MPEAKPLVIALEEIYLVAIDDSVHALRGVLAASTVDSDHAEELVTAFENQLKETWGVADYVPATPEKEDAG